MTPAFEQAVKTLKRLPGVGTRSAERIALHLLVERPERLHDLLETLSNVSQAIRSCPYTGNICEGESCAIYANPARDKTVICIVEQVPDLAAIERSGVFKGTYHVLNGKLSPINGVGPEQLNIKALDERIERDAVTEVILALSNDIEGEATCHYLQERIFMPKSLQVSRIGFGLPSGSNITYADADTLRNALDGRRDYT